jgi:hypothetical protein
MSRAILIKSRDFERDYQIYSSTLITLRLADDFSEITFYNSIEEKLDGEFIFIDEYEKGESYLLTRMYAPEKFKGAGLGRAALEFFKEYTGANIYARENDGVDRDDGIHLTEDAPGFVARMISEGLLQNN